MHKFRRVLWLLLLGCCKFVFAESVITNPVAFFLLDSQVVLNQGGADSPLLTGPCAAPFGTVLLSSVDRSGWATYVDSGVTYVYPLCRYARAVGEGNNPLVIEASSGGYLNQYNSSYVSRNYWRGGEPAIPWDFNLSMSDVLADTQVQNDCDSIPPYGMGYWWQRQLWLRGPVGLHWDDVDFTPLSVANSSYTWANLACAGSSASLVFSSAYVLGLGYDNVPMPSFQDPGASIRSTMRLGNAVGDKWLSWKDVYMSMPSQVWEFDKGGKHWRAEATQRISNTPFSSSSLQVGLRVRLRRFHPAFTGAALGCNVSSSSGSVAADGRFGALAYWRDESNVQWNESARWITGLTQKPVSSYIPQPLSNGRLPGTGNGGNNPGGAVNLPTGYPDISYGGTSGGSGGTPPSSTVDNPSTPPSVDGYALDSTLRDTRDRIVESVSLLAERPIEIPDIVVPPIVIPPIEIPPISIPDIVVPPADVTVTVQQDPVLWDGELPVAEAFSMDNKEINSDDYLPENNGDSDRSAMASNVDKTLLRFNWFGNNCKTLFSTYVGAKWGTCDNAAVVPKPITNINLSSIGLGTVDLTKGFFDFPYTFRLCVWCISLFAVAIGVFTLLVQLWPTLANFSWIAIGEFGRASSLLMSSAGQGKKKRHYVRK